LFSNDQNIETIGQLVEVLKHYIGLQSEYMKLDVVDKVVRLLTAITMVIVFSVLLILALIYLSFAAATALTPLVGMPLAFTIVAGAYLFILILVWTSRHQLIEKPLVQFLTSLLMQK